MISSVIAMFIINSTISFISVGVVVVVYGVLLRQKLTTPFEDVRSGLFVYFAEWAAKRTSQLAYRHERAWKPNLLIPMITPKSTTAIFGFLRDIALPQGSVKLLGIGTGDEADELEVQIKDLSRIFKQSGVFSSWAVLRTEKFAEGVNFTNQAYRGSFLKPNIVFLNMVNLKTYSKEFTKIIDEAARLQIGVLIYSQNPETGLGQRQTINVWIRNRAPNWKISWDIGNLDLSILVAYKLERNWDAKIRLVTVVENEEQNEQAEKFMSDLMDQARLPKTETAVYIDDFNQLIKIAPVADINIFGLEPDPDLTFIQRMVEETQTTCLFIRDSGLENIFA
jgi:hypothetical protein